MGAAVFAGEVHERGGHGIPEAAAAARYQLELEYVDVADITAAPGAHELLGELDRLGLPWAVVTSADPPLARTRLAAAELPPGQRLPVPEARDELRAELAGAEPHRLADEVGDLLFVIANLARKLDLDPEQCLRQANLKFCNRFNAIEQRAAAA